MRTLGADLTQWWQGHAPRPLLQEVVPLNVLVAGKSRDADGREAEVGAPINSLASASMVLGCKPGSAVLGGVQACSAAALIICVMRHRHQVVTAWLLIAWELVGLVWAGRPTVYREWLWVRSW